MNILITKPFFGQEEIDNVKNTLASGWVAQGPAVDEFEVKVAAHENIRYAVAASSCTTALHMALLAHGIGRGMDVLLPSFTFVATANAVVYTGAVPELVDIERDTYNISMDAVKEKIDRDYEWRKGDQLLINRKTGNILKAILVVHQFGLCAQMEYINSLAEKYHLTVLEDAACALGAKINGIPQGGFGNTSCVSFHPRKCITTGEGGMIFTNEKAVYAKLRELRSHGAEVSELERHHASDGFLLPSFSELGYNYRMSDIQAAIGLAQIDRLDYILEQRRYLAKQYDMLIEEVSWLTAPIEPEGYYHTYQSYVCFLEEGELDIRTAGKLRNSLMRILAEKGVQTRQGTHAVHRLAYYRKHYQYEDTDFMNAYQADLLTISLPLYVGMTDKEQRYVVDTLKESYDQIKNAKGSKNNV